jgi:hypothetical protein
MLLQLGWGINLIYLRIILKQGVSPGALTGFVMKGNYFKLINRIKPVRTAHSMGIIKMSRLL